MTQTQETTPRRSAWHNRFALALAVSIAFAVLIAAAMSSQAQSDEPQPPAPPQGSVVIPEAAPDLPPPVQSGEPLEPEIQIILREEETVTEYRVNGKLRAIKVEPAVGPAYYLVDTDGDGSLETRGELDGDLLIPEWVIFSW